MSGLVSLALSLCLRVWVDDVFVVSLLSLSSFSFKRESSGLTGHHTPPHVLFVFPFLFLSPPHWFVRLFWPCVLSVLAFLRGAILGPALFGFSRDFSEAFFLDARRQRRLLASFLWSFVFPVLWCLRLHTFLVGLAPGHRKAGLRVVSPAPLARVRVGG